eukprot:gene293-200_t
MVGASTVQGDGGQLGVPTTFVVRHGQSMANKFPKEWQSLVGRDRDPPLTEAGERMAFEGGKLFRKYLQPVSSGGGLASAEELAFFSEIRIGVSPMCRTLQTADFFLKGAGLEVRSGFEKKAEEKSAEQEGPSVCHAIAKVRESSTLTDAEKVSQLAVIVENFGACVVSIDILPEIREYVGPNARGEIPCGGRPGCGVPKEEPAKSAALNENEGTDPDKWGNTKELKRIPWLEDAFFTAGVTRWAGGGEAGKKARQHWANTFGTIITKLPEEARFTVADVSLRVNRSPDAGVGSSLRDVAMRPTFLFSHSCFLGDVGSYAVNSEKVSILDVNYGEWTKAGIAWEVGWPAGFAGAAADSSRGGSEAHSVASPFALDALWDSRVGSLLPHRVTNLPDAFRVGRGFEMSALLPVVVAGLLFVLFRFFWRKAASKHAPRLDGSA